MNLTLTVNRVSSERLLQSTVSEDPSLHTSNSRPLPGKLTTYFITPVSSDSFCRGKNHLRRGVPFNSVPFFSVYFRENYATNKIFIYRIL